MGKRARFAVRTIRSDGTIRLDGHVYRCRTDARRFAGQRAAFGRYGDDYPTVALWGSEKAFRSDDPDTDLATDWPGPFCEDGYFRWEWWDRVDG